MIEVEHPQYGEEPSSVSERVGVIKKSSQSRQTTDTLLRLRRALFGSPIVHSQYGKDVIKEAAFRVRGEATRT